MSLPTASQEGSILLKVAPEVRNMIYRLVLTACNSEEPNAKNRLCTYGLGSGISTAILSTCQQCYVEGVKYLYHLTKHVVHIDEHNCDLETSIAGGTSCPCCGPIPRHTVIPPIPKLSEVRIFVFYSTTYGQRQGMLSPPEAQLILVRMEDILMIISSHCEEEEESTTTTAIEQLVPLPGAIRSIHFELHNSFLQSTKPGITLGVPQSDMVQGTLLLAVVRPLVFVACFAEQNTKPLRHDKFCPKVTISGPHATEQVQSFPKLRD